MTYHSDPIGKIFDSELDELTYQTKFNSFKSENDFEKEMKKFMKNNQVLCILEVDYTLESQYLSYLKFKIDFYVNELFETTKKYFCIILTLSRSLEYRNSIPIFRGWDQIMLDRLDTRLDRQTNKGIELNDFTLSLNTKKLILHTGIFNFAENIALMTENALLKFRPKNTQNSQKYYEYIFFIVKNIRSDIKLVGVFEKKIKNYFEKLLDYQLKDWKKQIFFDKEITSESKDVKNAIFNFINKEIEYAFIQLVYYLEKNQAFASYFYKHENIEVLRNVWLENFEYCNIVNAQTKLQPIDSSNQIDNYEFLLNFPFSSLEYTKLSVIFAEYSEYSENSNKNTAKLIFKEKFDKATVLKDNPINDYPSLHEVYLKDMIILYLNENNMNVKSVNLVFRVLEKLYPKNENLQLKVLKFMKNKNN